MREIAMRDYMIQELVAMRHATAARRELDMGHLISRDGGMLARATPTARAHAGPTCTTTGVQLHDALSERTAHGTARVAAF